MKNAGWLIYLMFHAFLRAQSMVSLIAFFRAHIFVFLMAFILYRVHEKYGVTSSLDGYGLKIA